MECWPHRWAPRAWLAYIIFAILFHLLPLSASQVKCFDNCVCSTEQGEIVSADCSNAGYDAVPRGFPSTLKTLNLSRNQIRSLAGTQLSPLHNLITLDLSYNSINSVPTQECSPFVNMTELEELYLTDNLFTRMDNGSFVRLSSLKILDLSRNIISELHPRSFRGLVALKTLNLKSNLVMLSNDFYPQELFEDLLNLTELNIKNNVNFMECMDISPSLTTNPFWNTKGSSKNGRNNQNLKMANTSIKYIDMPSQNDANMTVGQKKSSFRVQGQSLCKGRAICSDHANTSPEYLPHNTRTVEGQAQPNHSYPDKALSRLSSLRLLHMDALPGRYRMGAGFRYLTNLSLLDLGSTNERCLLDCLPKLFFSNIRTSAPLQVLLTHCDIKTIHKMTFSYIPTLSSLSFKGNKYLQFKNFMKGSKSFTKTSLKTLDLTHIHQDGFITLKSKYFRHLENSSLETLIIAGDNIIDVDSNFLAILPKTIKYLSVSNNTINVGRFIANRTLMKNLEVLDVSVQAIHIVPNTHGQGDSDLEKTREHVTSQLIDASTRKGMRNQQQDCLLTVRKMAWLAKTHKNVNRLSKSAQHLMSAMLNIPSNRSETDFSSHLSFTELFPADIPCYTNLRVLYASDITLGYTIPAVNIGDNILETLDLSKNSLACFVGPVTGLKKLTDLNLSQNHCLQLNIQFFTDFPELRNLDLHDNLLGTSLESDEWGNSFSALVNLRTIDLSHNEIRFLSTNIFMNNSQLESIVLAHNGIYNFQPSIGHLKNLTLLDLSHNELPYLTHQNMRDIDTIKQVSNLTVDLSDNEFKCNCRSLDFLIWYSKTRGLYFRDHELYQCTLDNGNVTSLDALDSLLPSLWRICVGFDALLYSLIAFSAVLVLWTGVAVAHYYRFTVYEYLSETPVLSALVGVKKDVCVFYDDQEAKWRRFVWCNLKPTVEREGLSWYFSELETVPTAGRLRYEIIKESVHYTRKTLFLLTKEVFFFKNNGEPNTDNEMAVNVCKMVEGKRNRIVLIFIVIETMDRTELLPNFDQEHGHRTKLRYRNAPEFWKSLVEFIKA